MRTDVIQKIPTDLEKIIKMLEEKEDSIEEIVKTSLTTSVQIRNAIEEIRYKYRISARKAVLALTTFGVQLIDSRWGDLIEKIEMMRQKLIEYSNYSSDRYKSLMASRILDTSKIYVNSIEGARKQVIYIFDNIHRYTGWVGRMVNAEQSSILRLAFYVAMDKLGMKSTPVQQITNFDMSIRVLYDLLRMVLDRLEEI